MNDKEKIEQLEKALELACFDMVNYMRELSIGRYITKKDLKENFLEQAIKKV